MYGMMIVQMIYLQYKCQSFYTKTIAQQIKAQSHYNKSKAGDGREDAYELFHDFFNNVKLNTKQIAFYDSL